MNLEPIQYQLEDYELPEHCFASGTLYIEICGIDEMPYIWAYELKIRNADTGLVADYDFKAGANWNHPNAVMLQKDLHKDRALMDDIFDDCAREGMWS